MEGVDVFPQALDQGLVVEIDALLESFDPAQELPRGHLGFLEILRTAACFFSRLVKRVICYIDGGNHLIYGSLGFVSFRGLEGIAGAVEGGVSIFHGAFTATFEVGFLPQSVKVIGPRRQQGDEEKEGSAHGLILSSLS